MPEHASRFTASLYDQFEDEQRLADWGGDELFTRMPRPPAVDDAPPPRFKPSRLANERPTSANPRSLALVEAPSAEHRTSVSTGHSPDSRTFAGPAAARSAERRGLSVVEPAPAPVHRWSESGTLIEPEPVRRPTKVITGRPGVAPRPLPTVRHERRAPRTPAEWIGARPERIVGWAFLLGLLLILIAIATADAATI